MKKLQQIPKRKKEADKNFPNVINVKKPGMISDLSKFIKLSQGNVQGNLGLRHSKYIRTVSYDLLSSFLNWFKLVHEPFGQRNIHS